MKNDEMEMPLMLHATMTPVNVSTIASGMWRR